MKRFFVVAATVALCSLANTDVARAADTYVTTTRTGLAIDGKFAGAVKSATGGEPRIQVVEQVLSDGSVRKSPGRIELLPLTVKISGDLPPVLADWVTTTLEGKATTRTVQVIEYDGNGRVLRARELRKAMLTGVTIPLLAGSDKNALDFELEITPASVVDGGGVPLGQSAASRKAMACNFRVTLEGLPTRRISELGPITWSRGSGSGETARETTTAGRVNVSDISIRISGADLAEWKKWFTEALRGNATEKSGRVELLSPDLTTTMLTIELTNAGIYSVSADPDGNGRYLLKLYVERIGLVRGK